MVEWNCWVISCSVSWLTSKVVTLFTALSSDIWGFFLFLCIIINISTVCLYFFFCTVILRAVKWNAILVIIYASLIAIDVKHFIPLIVHFHMFYGEMCVQIHCSFYAELLAFIIFITYIFCISVYCELYGLYTILPFCYFAFFTVSCVVWHSTFDVLTEGFLIIFLLGVFIIISKTWLTNQSSWRFAIMFTSTSFMSFALRFVIFISKGYIVIFPYIYIV
jgi:hypothetical protein